MIHRKRIRALARTSVAVFIAAALGACSASTDPAPTAQSPVSPTRQSDTADSGSVLPEVVVTASRLSSPRVAAQTLTRPPAKRRGG
jgi:hypothetical protein